MTAPDRIWCHPTERQPVPAKDRRNAKWVRGGWKDHNSNAHGDVEYVRADLAAVQPAQVLETCGKCMGSGYGGHPDSGHLCADCNGNGGVEPQPDPRDKVLNQAMKDAITMGEGWIRTLQDGTLQLIDLSAIRLMPDAADPRDEVIARLVEALGQFLIEYDEVDLAVPEPQSLISAVMEARAALAAAKAVQHG